MPKNSIWNVADNFHLSFFYCDLSFSVTALLNVQGTLRDLSKGGRNISMDQTEPVSVTGIFLTLQIICFYYLLLWSRLVE